MSSTTRIRALAAFIAVTTGALLVVAGPAQAATSARTDTSDDVCWLNADTDEFQCFTDEVAFEQAVFEQTGAVLVESEEAPAARSALGILTVYTAVRFWDGGSYTGTQISVTTTNSAVCTSGSGIVGIAMPAGWNDRVSSFQTFLSCVTRVYEDVSLGGSFYGYATNAPSLGGLNNEGSSYRLI
jgi:hypothetical protein